MPTIERRCHNCNAGPMAKGQQVCNDKCREERKRRNRAFRRIRAKQKGLCRNCCFRKATIKGQCEPCRESMQRSYARPGEAEKHNATNTRRRQALVAKGICSDCLKAPRGTTKRCESCRPKHNRYLRVHQWRMRIIASANGKCTICRKLPAVEGKTLCAPCSIRDNIGAQKRRDKAIAANLCARCRQHPAEPRRRNCTDCSIKERARKKAQYSNKKVKGTNESSQV